jgi:hypothetical protein
MSAVEIERAVEQPPAAAAPAARSRVTGVELIQLCDDYWRLAQRLASTEFVPTSLRRRPEAVLAALLSGAERGLGPMESLRSINVIEGRPNLSAEAKRALVYAAGHHIEILESTAQRCVVIGRRAGSETTSPQFVWTIDRARRARLLQKDNWQKYPEAMLLARATSDLCNALFPDVVAGLETTEIVQDDIGPEPETRTTRRRLPTTTQTALQPAPASTPPVIDTDATDTLTATSEPPRSYRSERADMETASGANRPGAPMVDAEHGETPYDDPDDDNSTPWAPTPNQIPDADPQLAKRIHAEIRNALPDTISPRDIDQIRHGLVLVVTRKRPTGPTTSSNDLSHEEQMRMTELLQRAKAGTATITKAPDNHLELRFHGYLYDIDVAARTVDVRRVTPAAATEEGEPGGGGPITLDLE